eukprot:jgi/Tetstr1/464614/TSEL_009368.t1
MDDCLNEVELLFRLEADGAEILEGLQLAMSLDQDFRKIAAETAVLMNALGPVVRWAVRDWVAHVLVGNPLALQEEVPHPPDDTAGWRRRRNLLANDLLGKIRLECRARGLKAQSGGGRCPAERKAWSKADGRGDGPRGDGAARGASADGAMPAESCLDGKEAIDHAVVAVFRLLSVVMRQLSAKGHSRPRSSETHSDLSIGDYESDGASNMGDVADLAAAGGALTGAALEQLTASYSHADYTPTATRFGEWLELCLPAAIHQNCDDLTAAILRSDDPPALVPDQSLPTLLLTAKAAVGRSLTAQSTNAASAAEQFLPGGLPRLPIRVHRAGGTSRQAHAETSPSMPPSLSPSSSEAPAQGSSLLAERNPERAAPAATGLPSLMRHSRRRRRSHSTERETARVEQLKALDCRALPPPSGSLSMSMCLARATCCSLIAAN